ncbi:G1-S regulator (Dfp1/Him1) [Colletotrichum truncatum]|uniref:G1-S regulator (Dfp1/Him1) n=1 Tax=Colletotrichum truncatum TaxID=5467 RepID=A0ACC3YQP7_COLTU|nr:G1-S regulator (Dfp1/Him1) [Colletotrichum truncatum]KAF6798969.1 G1-S regulator (Dfp1/Him1) [Colletotrichum truncatum]
MAAISLSPTPIPPPAMSTRRTPLSSNPNVANSPLRAASALAQAKQKRSHANIQREELYGQPPPLKKQVIENTGSRQLRSPSKLTKPSQLPQRVARPITKERSTHHDDANVEKIRQWQAEYRGRFPKMVFYFESIPEDQRAKLSRHAMSLGARDERFFSSSITHVVTARPIPAQEEVQASAQEDPEPEEQPQTINPSLLDRGTDARRRLLFETSRRNQAQPQDDGIRRARSTRSNDVLHKARDMGKKIWSVEKFQRMLQFLLEPDPHVVAAYGAKGESSRSLSTKKTVDEPGLLQLLQHERLNGPSDAVTSREMINFKGPYIYVYDIDEKQKPIMVREYPKVNNKYDGEWPQFRTVTDGRCPFVEEPEPVERPSRKPQPQQKEQKEHKETKDSVVKPVIEERAALQPPEVPAPKAVIGKRTLAEMQDGQNKAKVAMKPLELFNPPKAVVSNPIDFRSQNAFTSRAGTGRLFAGEPVASGVQPSNVTSAIRSQMISSTSGVNGAKAGTSKEVHGLQRKVLQRGAPAPQDTSSRRLTEMSLDATSTRSTSVSRTTSRRMELIEEDTEKQTSKLVRTSSKTQAPPAKSKRDLKPGYCENCQDKFKDFDEHILTRKHRKFAENDDNWVELDDLLCQLGRMPKGFGRKASYGDDEVAHEWT